MTAFAAEGNSIFLQQEHELAPEKVAQQVLHCGVGERQKFPVHRAVAVWIGLQFRERCHDGWLLLRVYYLASCSCDPCRPLPVAPLFQVGVGGPTTFA